MRLSAFESRAENDAKPMRRDLFVFHSDPGVGADQSGERDLQAGLFFDFTRRARLKSLPEFQVAAGQVPESERFLLPLLHEQHAVSVADGHAHEDFDDLLIHLILKLENADVAEPRLARGPPRALAAVNLQPDVSFARVTLAVVFKVGHLHVVEPGGDVRGLAFDSRAQFVPRVLLEILLPIFVLLDKSAFGGSVEAADESTLEVINRDLIAHSVVADAQKQAGVNRVIGFELELDLIIGVLLFGADQPALVVFLLIGHERALFDSPHAAVAAMNGHQSPAIQALSVKQLLPYIGGGADNRRKQAQSQDRCDNISW